MKIHSQWRWFVWIIILRQPKHVTVSLATKINILLDDKALATQMGKAGRVRVLKIFSWESIAKTTYDYYQKVIDGFVREKA